MNSITYTTGIDYNLDEITGGNDSEYYSFTSPLDENTFFQFLQKKTFPIIICQS